MAPNPRSTSEREERKTEERPATVNPAFAKKDSDTAVRTIAAYDQQADHDGARAARACAGPARLTGSRRRGAGPCPPGLRPGRAGVRHPGAVDRPALALTAGPGRELADAA